MRHSVLTLAAVATLLGGTACHDATAPVAPPPAAVAASRTVLPTGPIVVTPADMHGWAFEHDGPHGACAEAARCRMTDGPGTPPLGTGSVALRPTHSSAAVIALSGYAGMRLDRIQGLRFATFIQPGGKRDDKRDGSRRDTRSDAEVTLELNVDYDLADRSTPDMGRLVYAPSPLREGEWQRWDARAGRWWGSREEVRVGGRTVENPCTEREPCTWAKLLRRFPSIGIHAVTGGLRLVARGGGEVTIFADEVIVGVGGAATTYDFEAKLPAPTGPESLVVVTDPGVTGNPTDADTTYAHGAAVSWSFDPPPAGRILTVYLDGAVVPSSGTVQMNARHFLYAALHPDVALRAGDQPLADAIRAVLASADPPAAFQSLMDRAAQSYAELGEDDAGAQLDRAIAAALDVVRDSAALRRVDAARKSVV